MGARGRSVAVVAIGVAGLLVRCGSSGGFGSDAGSDGTVADGATASDSSTDSPSFGDAAVDAASDVSCALGSAGSFATQASLDLFGQTVFFADGGTLPAGNYEIAYVDGCMKYSSAQDWTVNAYGEDAGTQDHWFLVDGPGGQTGTTYILTPPGTTGYLQQNGAYATFTDCVTGNLQLDQPRDFVFDGGQLGLWLGDNPYSDNVAGDNGRNPKWSLTLVGQPCPPPN